MFKSTLHIVVIAVKNGQENIENEIGELNFGINYYTLQTD